MEIVWAYCCCYCLSFELLTFVDVDVDVVSVEVNRPDFIELEKIVKKESIEEISKTPVRHSFNISEIPAMDSVFETCRWS